MGLLIFKNYFFSATIWRDEGLNLCESIVDFDVDVPFESTHYTWTTAKDSPEADPYEWRINFCKQENSTCPNVCYGFYEYNDVPTARVARSRLFNLFRKIFLWFIYFSSYFNHR